MPPTYSQEFLTSRSRTSDHIRCQRQRFWAHEVMNVGYQPIRTAVPLVAGVSFHAGAAALLNGTTEDEAVTTAIGNYADLAKDRNFDIDSLESNSFTYQEQSALVEALVRLTARRILPALLSQYEPLSVELLDKRTLYNNPGMTCMTCVGKGWLEKYPVCPQCGGTGKIFPWKITWRSITDSLLRKRDDGDLYLLSWKTCAQLPMENDARIDMQGVSEAWAIAERLERDYQAMKTGQDELSLKSPAYARMISDHVDKGYPPSIRGIQMCYLVKGQRRAAGKDALQAAVTEGLFSADQVAAGAKLYKTASPLIYGYMDTKAAVAGIFPVPMTFTKEYHCTGPHPMRKSQWYPTGMCDTLGKSHKRGDEWQSFAAWTIPGGIKGWIDLLDQGRIDPQAGDPLQMIWSLPVPNFRTTANITSWQRQTSAREKRISEALQVIRPIEQTISDDPFNSSARDRLDLLLDEHFPQNVEQCNHMFGRNCPMLAICWGPEHIKRDPLGSGIYQVKVPYKETVPEPEDE